MRTLLGFILMLATLLFVGCGDRPEAVKKGQVERDRAIQLYVENDNAEDDFLLQEYRKAQYKILDLVYENKVTEIRNALAKDLQALAANNPDGKLNLSPFQMEDIMVRVKAKEDDALASKEELKSQVDEMVAALYAVRGKNKINLAIATKLNEAITEFDNKKGMDMSMAQESIDQIFDLLRKYDVIGKDPGAAERDAKKKRVQPTQ